MHTFFHSDHSSDAGQPKQPENIFLYGEFETFFRHSRSIEWNYNDFESISDGTDAVDIKKCDIEKRDAIDYPDYVDMSCSMCPTMFDTIQNARQHYLEIHRLRNGYLRCCQIKMKSLTEVKEHIEWHSNPDLFR